jgi:hypothetical protein
MAVNHRSGRPEGAKGDSPGQSEAPPWDWCARNNPSPERAEPAARKPMCYVSPFQGFGELGRRRAQVAGVPRVALRSTLGYLICPVGANDPVEVIGEVRRLSGAIFIEMTIPDKPKSSNQRYRLTPLGKTIRARSIARGLSPVPCSS